MSADICAPEPGYRQHQYQGGYEIRDRFGNKQSRVAGKVENAAIFIKDMNLTQFERPELYTVFTIGRLNRLATILHE